jgi:hypothetical protein
VLRSPCVLPVSCFFRSAVDSVSEVMTTWGGEEASAMSTSLLCSSRSCAPMSEAGRFIAGDEERRRVKSSLCVGCSGGVCFLVFELVMLWTLLDHHNKGQLVLGRRVRAERAGCHHLTRQNLDRTGRIVVLSSLSSTFTAVAWAGVVCAGWSCRSFAAQVFLRPEKTLKAVYVSSCPTINLSPGAVKSHCHL